MLSYFGITLFFQEFKILQHYIIDSSYLRKDDKYYTKSATVEYTGNMPNQQSIS